MFKSITKKTLTVASAVLLSMSVAQAATIDLGFAIDESGSVNNSEFGLVRDGLAAALAQIPTAGDNTYRISVVYFSSRARTVVPVTTIDTASLQTVRDTITGARRQSGGTAIDSAVDLLTANFNAVGLGDTTLFNVSTDGGSSQSRLEAASLAAAAAGVDGLSYEAIGRGARTSTLLATAFPGTPVLIDDAADLPDPTTTSFVFQVDGFDDFESAIAAKVGRIIEVVEPTEPTDPTTPSPVPLPAGFPLMISVLGLLGGLRLARRKAA